MRSFIVHRFFEDLNLQERKGFYEKALLKKKKTVRKQMLNKKQEIGERNSRTERHMIGLETGKREISVEDEFYFRIVNKLRL